MTHTVASKVFGKEVLVKKPATEMFQIYFIKLNYIVIIHK